MNGERVIIAGWARWSSSTSFSEQGPRSLVSASRCKLKMGSRLVVREQLAQREVRAEVTGFRCPSVPPERRPAIGTNADAVEKVVRECHLRVGVSASSRASVERHRAPQVHSSASSELEREGEVVGAHGPQCLHRLEVQEPSNGLHLGGAATGAQQPRKLLHRRHQPIVRTQPIPAHGIAPVPQSLV